MNNQPAAELVAKRERTYCDCDQCKVPCHHQPGYLVPSDVDRIAKNLGTTREFFVKTTLRAVNTHVTVDDGEEFDIPLLTPVLARDGGCILFDKDKGQCLVHQVAPYGCRCFNACSPQDDDHERNADAFAAIMEDPKYLEDWSTLNDRQNQD